MNVCFLCMFSTKHVVHECLHLVHVFYIKWLIILCNIHILFEVFTIVDIFEGLRWIEHIGDIDIVFSYLEG